MKKETLFSWHRNGWDRWSWYWWKHWFNWKALYRDVRDMWYRANYGYAPRDLWSLDHYLASWMPHALEEFRSRACGHPSSLTEDQWNEELMIMQHGWIAAQHILWQCDHECYSMAEHDAYWGRHWHYCHKIFMKRFFSLWW